MITLDNQIPNANDIKDTVRTYELDRFGCLVLGVRVSFAPTGDPRDTVRALGPRAKMVVYCEGTEHEIQYPNLDEAIIGFTKGALAMRGAAINFVGRF